MKNAIIVLFFSFIGARTCLSQTKKEINDQVQFWTSINSTWRLSDDWGLMGDFHIRRNDFIQDPNFYFLRAGGVYWFNDKISLAGGGALLWYAWPDGNDDFNFSLEKRLYQQLLWRSVNGRAKFLQRIRTEQRWQQVLDPDGSVNRVRFTNRVRFLFSASIRIFKDEKKPRLVLSDEILFQFGEEIVYNTFDQNRFFVGINDRIGKNWTFDFGYMPVFQQKSSGYRYDLNHTIRLFFYLSPDLRKKKDTDMPHYPVGGME